MLSRFSCAQLFATPWMQCTRLLCLWDSPGRYSGVRCHACLQGIFPTQGLNPCLLLSPALASRFFTASTTWEARKRDLPLSLFFFLSYSSSCFLPSHFLSLLSFLPLFFLLLSLSLQFFVSFIIDHEYLLIASNVLTLDTYQ